MFLSSSKMHKIPFLAYADFEVITMEQLKKYTITGTFFVLITGTLSHFIYEWSGNNFIVGFFCPVNESTWEHMKLVFFPMFLFSIFMFKRLKGIYPCILQSSSLGILIGTFLVPVLFYTYAVPQDKISAFNPVCFGIDCYGVLYPIYLSCTSNWIICYPDLTSAIDWLTSKNSFQFQM